MENSNSSPSFVPISLTSESLFSSSAVQNMIDNSQLQNQFSNSYYEPNLVETFEILHESEQEDSEYLRDGENENGEYLINSNSSSSEENYSSSSSHSEDNSQSNDENYNSHQETSTVNSNDICLNTSFYENGDIDFGMYVNRENSKSPREEFFKLRGQGSHSGLCFEHRRVNSAPQKVINELEEFKFSMQYVNLEKAFLQANKLILIRSEGKFDIESKEGNEICKKFLKQIEQLMISMRIKTNNRDYRKKFSKAYICLFEENSLSYITEILDNAQESTPYLVLNGEKFTFSKEVLDYGNQLFSAFCSLIMLLTDSVNKIREEIFYDNIKELKADLKKALTEFDKKWTLYEEKYINELIEIEKQSRRYIIEGINLEKELTQYEIRTHIKGNILINDKQYNQLCFKFIELINNLNRVANIEGKGRDDLGFEIFKKAEQVLLTVSDGKSKGMRNLAISIKKCLFEMREFFKKYENNIEGIDPQLRNNQDLSEKLYDFEIKWERGKDYLMDELKYSQLLFFSEMIEILCEKYAKYSIYNLIEDSDPSIFVSIPCILLLKAIDNEDKHICIEYIPNILNEEDESGKLFTFLKGIKRNLVEKVKDDYLAYNLLEKLILFDGTKEQEMIEKQVENYLEATQIKEFKKSLINLSVHLQRYKPAEWNTFFELAMNIE
ncbi:MAG: hypothetical protein MJ252_00705 [archaeon]|nr:hypothetical protein [archaeon]